MKVKLLKKVRKRWDINCIWELPSDAHWELDRVVERLGLPFYIIMDNDVSNEDRYVHQRISLDDDVFRTYEEAHKSLTKRIVSAYEEKFRHSDGKATKVWWDKDNNHNKSRMK